MGDIGVRLDELKKRLKNLSRQRILSNKSFENKKDIACVCCYFNPCGYKSKLKNYRTFYEGIKRTGVKLLTVELAFGGDEFELSEFENVLQLRTSKDNVMWQKERLLNIGIQKLIVEGYKKIAWLDADIVFEDDSWVDKLSNALDRYKIVQVFSEVHRIGWESNPKKGYQESSTKYFEENKDFCLISSAPGFGWAARSDILSQINLYDSSILGGGDSLILFGFYFFYKYLSKIKANPFLDIRFSPLFRNHYFKWAKRTGFLIKSNIGYVDVKITALLHGDVKNRKYIERNQIYLNHDFNPELDIKLGSNSCFEWASNKPELHKEVRDYFYSRKEDE